MKKITLKPVTIPMPQNVPNEVRVSVAKAEAALRENYAMLENTINAVLGLLSSISGTSEAGGGGQLTNELIEGTQTAATGLWTGVTKESALYDGMHILYRLPYAGSGNASLNLTLATGAQTGDKPVYRYGTTHVTTHYVAGSVVGLTYLADADAWYADADYTISATYTSGYCTTGKTTAAKAASMTYFALHPNEWVFVNFRYANTKAGAITLNINSTGAKPLYINGSPSSSTNYSFPAGSYLVFYDGTNYYLRTDGLLPQAIS
jgi:hypothetical protein